MMLKTKCAKDAERDRLIAEPERLTDENSNATHWSAPISARARRIDELRWMLARLEDD
jgi:hypothetical protein